MKYIDKEVQEWYNNNQDYLEDAFMEHMFGEGYNEDYILEGRYSEDTFWEFVSDLYYERGVL